MDATRLRRTRDPIRQRWYALWRARRFARFLGFPCPDVQKQFRVRCAVT